MALAGFTTPKEVKADPGRIKSVNSLETEQKADKAKNSESGGNTGKATANASSKAVASAAKKSFYTPKEIDMITAVVMNEVGHCTRPSKIAVTNVILNRVKAGKSVYDVLHEPGQFTAINNYYSMRLVPNASTKEAVLAAIAGEDNSRGAIFYCNPRFLSNRSLRFFNSRTYLFTLEGQNFYK